MQITSPKNLSALYASNQVGAKPQPEDSAPRQAPASVEKTDTVSISAEALRKQTESTKRATSAAKDAERSQEQIQTPPASPAKNTAAQRIDLIA